MTSTHSTLLLTILGPDRPGLVELLSQQVAAYDGNWLDSSMSRLAGKFAGILRIAVPSERAEELSRALTDLATRGLRILIEPCDSPDEDVAGFTALRLEVVGTDRPGIIRDLSRALAARGINVESLDTEVLSAPMSGELLFQAGADLHVPPSVAIEELQSALEALGDSLMVDIDLQSTPS